MSRRNDRFILLEKPQRKERIHHNGREVAAGGSLEELAEMLDLKIDGDADAADDPLQFESEWL